ncbi:unnamed protein product [Polarella glacialis]|uniref:Uncharacterized protein n=1 Tax=Polarella glacialis TaxID=89957 RepID=A0A813EEG8_POLGL|nr:unnamed protein product [Polarella glacialis]
MAARGVGLKLAALGLLAGTRTWAEETPAGDRFMEWFADELREVDRVPLKVTGKLPSYLTGLMVQPGPGRFTMGEYKMNHALDGFSKINRLEFDAKKNSVIFSAQFLESGFYNESKESNAIAHSMLLCEPAPGRSQPHGLLNVLGANDNNYIKARKIGDTEFIASDTNVVTFMTGGFSKINDTVTPSLMMKSHNHWEDSMEPEGRMCMMAAFAHGHEDPDTGDFISVTSCVALMPGMPQSHIIFKIHPSNPRRREKIAELTLPSGRSPSYMHAFGVTERYVVLVATPLYMDLPAVMQGKGLAEGGLLMPVEDHTLFQVVDKTSGKLVKEYKVPGFLFGHVVNAFEDGPSGDIVIDVTFKTMESRSFFEYFKTVHLGNMIDRDLASKGTIMRYKLHPEDGTVETSYTLPNEPSCDIEVPRMHPARVGKPYCVFWGVQFGSNATLGFASFAVVKRNWCTGEQITSQKTGHFPAEHEFVPKYPDGKQGAEDEGTLVGIVFDSIQGESYVQVLDAQTLEKIAEAPLGIKVPFPVHASFFPSAAPSAANPTSLETLI